MNRKSRAKEIKPKIKKLDSKQKYFKNHASSDSRSDSYEDSYHEEYKNDNTKR